MPVTIDLREGHQVEETRERGFSVTRTAKVTGLTGPRSSLVYQALQNINIPRLGDPHPEIPGITLQRRRGAPDGPTSADISLIYERPQSENESSQDKQKDQTEEGLIQVGSSIVDAEVNKDAEGNSLEISYQAQGSNVIETQIARVSINIPQAVRTLERIENFSPLPKADQYVGSVNKTAIWGRPARTLLCRAINGSSRDGGLTWRVSYEFQYKPGTWDQLIFFKDPETGEPQEGIEDGNGQELRRLYREEEFGRMGISF